jgi:hypothetical protein
MQLFRESSCCYGSRDENRYIEDTKRTLLRPIANSQRIKLKILVIILPASFPPYQVLLVVTHRLGGSGTDNGFI